MALMAYKDRKTAQIAARILSLGDGTLNIVKLMKLLYLVDREALSSTHRPLTGDRMVSMPHGPVLSRTYEASQGYGNGVVGGWNSWMADRANHLISLREGITATREALDELSDMDIVMIDRVWERFGAMNPWDLVTYTHNHCAEWVDPCGSSAKIDYETVLQAVGKPLEQAQEIAREIEAENFLDATFARI
ncbi:Panacea domain-containing protein [Stenotrophomonas maltophilia]|uniref:Panacea domain-containing protein n=1 Tax=Stenotrophomonas maltophilia TaxID=40324 RepID=UPI00209AA7E9|nr:Panacea domain-containing protein [Stenotrophomonas maltophilia]MCO7487736.1 Panacea domain-containing protein [Stenotrophomonas maltophilia]